MKVLQQILACVMSLNLGKVNISASERYGGAHKCNHGIAYRQYAKDTYVSTCDRIWHALLKESRDLISALDTRQRSREWITRHVSTRTQVSGHFGGHCRSKKVRCHPFGTASTTSSRCVPRSKYDRQPASSSTQQSILTKISTYAETHQKPEGLRFHRLNLLIGHRIFASRVGALSSFERLCPDHRQ